MKKNNNKIRKGEGRTYVVPACEIIYICAEGRMMVPASAGQEDYEYKDFWASHS